MKYYACFILIIIVLSLSKALAEDPSIIHAKLASAEIEGDLMTVWSRKFANYMQKTTNSKFDLTVYPYGTIGSSMNINQLCQLGTIDFVFAGAAYLGAFVPEVDLINIHYLWPRKNIDKILKYIIDDGHFYKMLTKSFQDRGLYPLSIFFEGWQWVTSKAPIVHFRDIRDQKIRVMSSKMLIEQYKIYGFSPTTMDYGEIYSSLQTGVLDAQVQPMFANYSMKFYEVTSNFTQMWAEPFLGIPVVNNKFFQSLPASIKEKILNFWHNEITPSYLWINKKNLDDKKKIKLKNPNVQYFTFTDNDINQAKKLINKKLENNIDTIITPQAKEMLPVLKYDIKNAVEKIKKENTKK